MMNDKKTALIIGAGPAGLTAAYELIEQTDIKPVIVEMSADIGGISKTVNYKGNRIDIGGHRFFSKSDRVMAWWLNLLPLQKVKDSDRTRIDISYQQKTRSLDSPGHGPDPDKTDRVMLIRSRLSRIFYLRKFFNYPIALNANTISNLGLARMVKIGFSYLKARLFPIKEEKSLEDFFINRFGKVLYQTFFKDYTEKVWGLSCREIAPDWGAQRIKGLSVSRAIFHAIRNIAGRDNSLGQKSTETSLIEQFLYPKFGPGQMWETVADLVREKGASIYLKSKVVGVYSKDNRIVSLKIKDENSGDTSDIKADYFFSSMPVRDLIRGFGEKAPEDVRSVARGLQYRDFITVGLLLNKLRVRQDGSSDGNNALIRDNWIYIQESDVKVGRLQIFNNWSPWMVKDRSKVWIGLEYFCNETDALWKMSDRELRDLAVSELTKIDIIDPEDVADATVIRMPKTYPAYFGSYGRFSVIRQFTDRFENLFLIGRNGMHRYNNQDHSMLTAMTAVENIRKGIKTKDNIWSVNTEEAYHEEEQ